MKTTDWTADSAAKLLWSLARYGKGEEIQKHKQAQTLQRERLRRWFLLVSAIIRYSRAFERAMQMETLMIRYDRYSGKVCSLFNVLLNAVNMFVDVVDTSLD